MPPLLNAVSFYKATGKNNAMLISLPLEAYNALQQPRGMVFNETDASLHTSSLNTAKDYKITVNGKRAILTVLLLHSSIDNLLGSWEYEIDDLSLYITDKIKLQ